MLTRKDIDDLFELLAIFRENDPHLRNRPLRSAWHLVLAPYGKDDVREAIGAWFRRAKYWPDVAEIAALCPPLPEGKAGAAQPHGAPPGPAAQLWKQWDSLKGQRREAGVPATIREAAAAGLTDRDWLGLLADKGLALPLPGSPPDGALGREEGRAAP